MESLLSFKSQPSGAFKMSMPLLFCSPKITQIVAFTWKIDALTNLVAVYFYGRLHIRNKQSMWCATRKQTLRSLSLGPHQSFFGYDTDCRFVISNCHKINLIVGVIPQEGLAGMTTIKILKLVAHRLNLFDQTNLMVFGTKIRGKVFDQTNIWSNKFDRVGPS